MKNKLILAALSLLLFLALIIVVRTVDVAAIGPADTSVGLSHVNQSVHDSLGESDTWYTISQYLGYASLLLAAGFALLGMVQLVRGKGLNAVDPSLFVLAGLYVAVAVLYVFFDKVAVNYRPVLEPGQTVPESSFPSTHTLMACVIYGSAVMVLPRFVKQGGLLRALQALCIVALVLTVAARLLSGVHWFTDILGGLLLSLSLLSFSSAMLMKFAPAEGQAN